MDRRQFITGAAALAAYAALPQFAQAEVFKPGQGRKSPDNTRSDAEQVFSDLGFWERPRTLWLYRPATKENVKITYFDKNGLNQQGYWAICGVLRDHRENLMCPMDIALLDTLRGIQGYLEAYGVNKPLVVNSAFRTTKSNSKLSKEGAVKNSMHLYGKAVDIWVPDVPIKTVGKIGQYFRQGGVGFYESKNFVHLDTGKLRSWRG